MALSKVQIAQENFVNDTDGKESNPHETVTWDEVVKGLGLRSRWRILLKNSSLIGEAFADSIPILMGELGDDGTKAGSTGSTVL